MIFGKKNKGYKGYSSVKEAIDAPERIAKNRTRIVKADSEDFKKQASEIETKSQVKEKKPKKTREETKKRLVTILGAAFIIFAIIGMISTGTGIVKGITALIKGNTRKAKYEQFLTPVVMLDPVYFDSSAKAGQGFLIQSSLWYLIYNNGTDSYRVDDVGSVIIPQSDVEVAANALYGKSVQLVHQSVGDLTNITAYVEDSKAYHLPLSSGFNVYKPIVHSIQRSGETVTLTVGYIPPSPNWGENRKIKEVPDKFAYYVLKENSSGMTLVAIKEMASEQQEELIEKYKK